MTNQEAIARIKDHKIVHKMNEPRAIHISEALDMAIHALEQERNVIEELEKIKEEFENKEGVFTSYHFVKAIDERIAELKGEQK